MGLYLDVMLEKFIKRELLVFLWSHGCSGSDDSKPKALKDAKELLNSD